MFLLENYNYNLHFYYKFKEALKKIKCFYYKFKEALKKIKIKCFY